MATSKSPLTIGLGHSQKAKSLYLPTRNKFRSNILILKKHVRG